jgi:hypothetical protein
MEAFLNTQELVVIYLLHPGPLSLSIWLAIIKFCLVFFRGLLQTKKMSKDLTNLNIQIETSLNKLHQRDTGMHIYPKKESRELIKVIEKLLPNAKR